MSKTFLTWAVRVGSGVLGAAGVAAINFLQGVDVASLGVYSSLVGGAIVLIVSVLGKLVGKLPAQG